MLVSELKGQLELKLEKAKILLDLVRNASSIDDKLAAINELESSAELSQKLPHLLNYMSHLDAEGEYLTKLCYALGQGKILFRQSIKHQDQNLRNFKLLVQHLIVVERFYTPMGGLLGYYCAFLGQLLAEPQLDKDTQYKEPDGTDISTFDSVQVKSLVLEGLNSLPKCGALFPIGGAGDRFGLVDERTGEAMPVACLKFNGSTLLEGLFNDLSAQEYLYYKLHKTQVYTPCVIMTSAEKGNHQKVQAICEKLRYFGRGKKRIVFLKQPLVPVLTERGDFSLKGDYDLSLKPGGHGVIWRLCTQAKAFQWLRSLERQKVIVRQINNPIAGTDYGLLAFLGAGFKQEAHFGFASCHRNVGAAEGVNVHFKKHSEGSVTHGISNIEYTEFEKNGIVDEVKGDSSYSKFPANTNILFADIDAVSKAAMEAPVPGQIINLKHHFSFIDSDGNPSSIPGGRLESLMQNIADYLGNREDLPLHSFVTFNHRSKTISSAKAPYSSGKPIDGTSHGAFYTYWSNTYSLLKDFCNFKLPKMYDASTYVEKGPSFYFKYMPAMGPLYSIIGQKIRGGELFEKSSLVLDIAEVNIEALSLQGALEIKAHNPLGREDQEGHVLFGEEWSGKCTLKNVSIKNAGLKESFWHQAWKGDTSYNERLKIEIEGCGEFYAEDLTFEGDTHIRVSDGVKVTAKMDGGKLVLEEEPLKEAPTWKWEYSTNASKEIILESVALNASMKKTAEQPKLAPLSQ